MNSILAKNNMWGSKGDKYVDTAATIASTEYAGALEQAAAYSRQELAPAVSILTHHSSISCERHRQLAKDVLRYLARTQGRKITEVDSGTDTARYITVH